MGIPAPPGLGASAGDATQTDPSFLSVADGVDESAVVGAVNTIFLLVVGVVVVVVVVAGCWYQALYSSASARTRARGGKTSEEANNFLTSYSHRFF